LGYHVLVNGQEARTQKHKIWWRSCLDFEKSARGRHHTVLVTALDLRKEGAEGARHHWGDITVLLDSRSKLQELIEVKVSGGPQAIHTRPGVRHTLKITPRTVRHTKVTTASIDVSENSEAAKSWDVFQSVLRIGDGGESPKHGLY
jgi:hypothetical protein